MSAVSTVNPEKSGVDQMEEMEAMEDASLSRVSCNYVKIVHFSYNLL